MTKGRPYSFLFSHEFVIREGEGLVSARMVSYHVGTGIRLYVTDCARCGVVFAIPAALEARRREDGLGFYCPSGHSLSFGQSEVEKLKSKLADARSDVEWYRVAEKEAREGRDAAERSAAAFKGHLTRIRRLVLSGLCPWCRRNFPNVHEHCKKQHPEMVEKLAEATASQE